MKKQYTSPQFDYWCYMSGKLCDGVGAALYATARRNGGLNTPGVPTSTPNGGSGDLTY